MSEDTSEGFADQPRLMVSCRGCGFSVEPEHARGGKEDEPSRMKRWCGTCAKCERTPEMRESYRRGFNAGLEKARECIRESADALRGYRHAG